MVEKEDLGPRPEVPSILTASPNEYIAAKKAEFIWDARTAGFTESQAEFLYSRYGAHAVGPFGF